MDQRPKAKTIKLSERKIGLYLHNLGLGNGFLNMTPKAQATKEKANKLDYIKTKKYLYIEGYYQKSENTTHRMGDYICK